MEKFFRFSVCNVYPNNVYRVSIYDYKEANNSKQGSLFRRLKFTSQLLEVRSKFQKRIIYGICRPHQSFIYGYNSNY